MTLKKHRAPANLTKRLFRTEWEYLTQDERDTIEKALHRISIPRDTNHEFEEKSTFGQRAADGIASFGGSWTFIILFSIVLLLWAFINTEVLGPRHEAFDPYPEFNFIHAGRPPSPSHHDESEPSECTRSIGCRNRP